MNTAIVVITHKRAGKAMMEVVEMICGHQDNAIAVDFLEQEDMESLVVKCQLEMESLDTGEGVLFLVDLFGGTPFNAAYTISRNYKKQAVLAGVNIPMLIDIFVSGEHMGLEELCKAAQRSGVEGIRIAARASERDEDDE